MKLMLVLMFASFGAFGSDFICSAKIIEQDKVKSTLEIDGYWYSSTTYSGQKLDYPNLYVDMIIDGRTKDEPKIQFKLKRGRKLLKTISVESLGKSEEYKLGKTNSLKFECS